MRRTVKIVALVTACLAGTTFMLTSGDAATRLSASAGEYHACLTTKTHKLSNVVYGSKARSCAAHQESVSWNVQGRTGAREQ